MKILTNWRYYIMLALLAVVFMNTVMFFGSDDMPIGLWLFVRVCLALGGIGAAMTLRTLIQAWEYRGEIPEYTRLSKNV